VKKVLLIFVWGSSDFNFEQALIDLGYDTVSLDDYVLNENID